MRMPDLVLLLAPAALAVDVSRVSTHAFDASMVDHAEYTDYFHGDYALRVEDWINASGSEYVFVRSRLPPGFNLTSWQVNTSSVESAVMAIGTNDAYASKRGDTWKVGGKGFIDRICDELQPQTMQRIEQEFESTIILPGGMEVIEAPDSKADNLRYIEYDYSVSVNGRKLVEKLKLAVKGDVDVVNYCNERSQLEEVLRKGFIVGRRSSTPAYSYATLAGLAVLVVLVYSAARLVGKSRRRK
ncbi:hypothetical protein HYS54_03835 [Candidatus Micrarchaeota archaeon]|nr:hypothetical protein [Candidatus Micrarchaeota archaeon]